MPDPRDGPDAVIRDDLDRVVRDGRAHLSSLSGASLLLTGATGFVGRTLVETVIRSNEVLAGPPCVMTVPTRHPDVLRARYPRQVAAGQIKVVAWGDRHAIDSPARDWDYVVHGSATTDPATFRADPDGSLRDTVEMAASVASAATTAGARRVVLISSGAVYGDQPADLAAFPEAYQGGSDRAGDGVASYAEAKRGSETSFRDADVDLRIARVFSLIGPYQDLESTFAVPDLIRQAAAGRPITLTTDGSARRSFCYASDLAGIIFWLLLGEPRHEVYNVGSRDGTTTIAEVAATIAEIFGGLDVQRPTESGSQRDYVPELARLYDEYVPRTGLRDGLVRTCHSLFARGLIDRRPAVELGR